MQEHRQMDVCHSQQKLVFTGSYKSYKQWSSEIWTVQFNRFCAQLTPSPVIIPSPQNHSLCYSCTNPSSRRSGIQLTHNRHRAKGNTESSSRGSPGCGAQLLQAQNYEQSTCCHICNIQTQTQIQLFLFQSKSREHLYLISLISQYFPYQQNRPKQLSTGDEEAMTRNLQSQEKLGACAVTKIPPQEPSIGMDE